MKYVALALLSVSGLVYADDYAPCGNGGYVNMGDTQAQLLQECGQPTTAKQYQDTSNSGSVHKVRWHYTQNLYVSKANTPNSMGINQEASYTVEFKNGVVNMIYGVDNMPYESYNFCGTTPAVRGTVQVGDTMNEVTNECGQPAFTSDEGVEQGAPPKELTEYRYQFDQNVPAVVVTLENGVVTNIQ